MAQVAPIPTETKLKLRKAKVDTLPPITPSMDVEESYKEYLDTIVGDITSTISEDITPIFTDLVNIEISRINYNTDLDKASTSVNDAVSFTPEEQFNNQINILNDKLVEQVIQAKVKFESNLTSYIVGVERFVGAVDTYTQNQLFKQISSKYGTSRVKFLSLDEIGVPFNKAVDTNVKLIKSVGDEYLDKVSKAVKDNFSKVAKKGDISLVQQILDEREGVTLRRAETIARDQSAKTTESFNAARYKNYGLTEAVWAVADLSDRTRPSHLKLNGEVFLIEKGAEKGDGTFIFPSSEVNCRCTSRPIVPKGLFE